MRSPEIETARTRSIFGKGKALHSRTVASALAVTRVLPSGENATAVTGPVCRLKMATSCFVAMDHNLARESLLPVARVLPSGENARLLMIVCPVMVPTECRRQAHSLPVYPNAAKSHSFTMLYAFLAASV